MSEEHLFLAEPWPNNPAAEIALQHLIWRSESLSSRGSSSPDDCFFTDTGMMQRMRVGIIISASAHKRKCSRNSVSANGYDLAAAHTITHLSIPIILDSLRGSSVNIGTIQRILAWPPRKDDAHKSRSV